MQWPDRGGPAGRSISAWCCPQRQKKNVRRADIFSQWQILFFITYVTDPQKKLTLLLQINLFVTHSINHLQKKIGRADIFSQCQILFFLDVTDPFRFNIILDVTDPQKKLTLLLQINLCVTHSINHLRRIDHTHVNIQLFGSG